jgi:hypothetical protein
MVGGAHLTQKGRDPMAESQLRISGWHIPCEYRDEYPCWEFAHDEEGREGQDETTMRLCKEPRITEDTDVAVAYALGANGERFPAVVQLEYPDRTPNDVMIYVDGTFGGRVVEFSTRRGTWTEYKSKPGWFEAWTSAKSEPGLLPVQIVTLAASAQTGAPLSFTVAKLE